MSGHQRFGVSPPKGGQRLESTHEHRALVATKTFHGEYSEVTTSIYTQQNDCCPLLTFGARLKIVILEGGRNRKISSKSVMVVVGSVAPWPFEQELT